jgi:hypothetical protein
MEAREIRERNFNLPFSLTSLISLCSLLNSLTRG